MKKIYIEGDVTWSSIEKDFSYTKAIWELQSNGIPKYTLLNDD